MTKTTMTVGELAAHSGLTVRTLHHYDQIVQGLPEDGASLEQITPFLEIYAAAIHCRFPMFEVAMIASLADRLSATVKA